MKKLVIVLLLTTLVFTAFARGKQETRMESFEKDFIERIEQAEKVELTGNIALKNKIFPELTVGADVYELIIFPMHLRFQADIQDGDVISLEGVIVTEELQNDLFQGRGRGPGMMRMDTADDGNTKLLVTKITIGGEEYNIEDFREYMDDHRGFGRKGHKGRFGGDDDRRGHRGFFGDDEEDDRDRDREE